MLIRVMTADASHAKIFDYHGSTDDLHEIATMDNPNARLHEQDLVSDRGGASSNGGLSGGHGVNGENGAKKHEVERFAKSLGEHLYKGRMHHDYDRLYIAASPTLLGSLRRHYHTEVANVIAGEIDKNLVEQSPDAIRKHLPKTL